ncbi:MAG: hypothetical protein ACR2RV_04170 [Verrucomicrobiales bacterium]
MNGFLMITGSQSPLGTQRIYERLLAAKSLPVGIGDDSRQAVGDPTDVVKRRGL